MSEILLMEEERQVHLVPHGWADTSPTTREYFGKVTINRTTESDPEVGHPFPLLYHPILADFIHFDGEVFGGHGQVRRAHLEGHPGHGEQGPLREWPEMGGRGTAEGADWPGHTGVPPTFPPRGWETPV